MLRFSDLKEGNTINDASYIRRNAAGRFRAAAARVDVEIVDFLVEMRSQKAAESAYGIDASFPNFQNLKLDEVAKREMVTMFFDLRGSTVEVNRMQVEGAYILYSTLLPILAEIVVERDGFVVDYTGDGFMAAFGFSEGEPTPKILDHISNAIDTAWMVKCAVKTILSPMLTGVKLLYPDGVTRQFRQIDFGIGISHGNTIITRYGVRTELGSFIQSKLIGASVSDAAKLSGQYGGYDNRIVISSQTSNAIPTSNGHSSLAKYQVDSVTGTTASYIRKVNHLSFDYDLSS